MNDGLHLLENRVAVLEDTVSLLHSILKVLGYPITVWLPPNQAAPLLGISPSQLRNIISTAEAERIAGHSGVLQYGIHYRNVMSSDSTQNAWQVSIEQMSIYLSLPPEQR